MVAISAPGKVFVAGGYLVLDRRYSALTFGLSARMHVVAKSPSTSSKKGQVIVRSPQFRDAEWHYDCQISQDNLGVQVSQLERTSEVTTRNKFVETSLTFALSYLVGHGLSNVEPVLIDILADDDYYSQSHTSTKCAGNPHSRFNNFNVRLADAHKTGLGSSAALVTAFTAAVLAFYLPEQHGALDKEKVHNLAQAAHCNAQGKIGSGFDVATAIYGSCIYHRFSPSVLEQIGEPGDRDFVTRLAAVVDDGGSEKIWDVSIKPSAVVMPQSLRLVMCDVDCGSETPGMVKKVLAWRKEQPEEALLLWETLQNANNGLAKELRTLVGDPRRGYGDLKDAILTIRSLIREMSAKANVRIEPKEQTALLDACSARPGVIGGVVPGAGGYDAITLLVENKQEVLDDVELFLDRYQAESLDGDVKIGKVRLLSVKEEFEGLRLEQEGLYKGWLDP